jgi:hypothetical protein
LMPIRIWIGFNMEIRIRIGIKTMLIHNSGILLLTSPGLRYKFLPDADPYFF